MPGSGACALRLGRAHPFVLIDAAVPGPVLPILLWREGMRRWLRVDAIVDTGSPFPLVLSGTVGARLLRFGPPGPASAFRWGVKVPAITVPVSVRAPAELQGHRRIDALLPNRSAALGGTILGRPLLADLNLCFRGPSSVTVVADSSATIAAPRTPRASLPVYGRPPPTAPPC